MGNEARFRASLDDKVSSKLDRIRDKFNTIGGKGTAASLFGNIGAKAAGVALGFVSNAAGKASDFLGDSITAASDLNETLAKSSVVFGGSADEIEKWGSTTARRFGTSKNAAIGAAASFADLFNTVGLATKPAKEMSTNLVELAADLASFHNVAGGSPEVLEKLRSGLSGEAEPMRRLGVFMSETKVRAKALELGLAGAHGELTEGDKILARYEIILDETRSAQGDFARTAEELANKQRTANAVLEDNQAVLGKKMLPAQLAVTNAQIDLFTGINALADAIGGKMTPESIALTVALGGMSKEQAKVEIATRAAAAATAEAAKISANAYTAMESKRGAWSDTAKKVADTIPQAIDTAGRKAKVNLDARINALVSTLRGRRGAFADAAAGVADATWDPQINKAELALVNLALKDKDLLARMKSKDRATRLAAEVEYANLKKDQARLRAAVQTDSEQSKAELDAALTTRKRLVENRGTQLSAAAIAAARVAASALPDAVGKTIKATDTAALRHRNRVKARLTMPTYTWGQHAGQRFGDGLASMYYYVNQAAKELASGARGPLEFTEPKEGPLRGMKTWGQHAGQLWADALSSQAPYLTSKVEGYLAGAADRFSGALVPRGGVAGGFAGITAGGLTPAVVRLVLPDGRVLAELVDENLFYRRQTAPRT